MPQPSAPRISGKLPPPMALKPPRLSGSTLAAVRMAAETKGTDVAIREVMKRGLGIDQLAALPEAWRGDAGLDARPLAARARAVRGGQRGDGSGGAPVPETRGPGS